MSYLHQPANLLMLPYFAGTNSYSVTPGVFSERGRFTSNWVCFCNAGVDQNSSPIFKLRPQTHQVMLRQVHPVHEQRHCKTLSTMHREDNVHTILNKCAYCITAFKNGELCLLIRNVINHFDMFSGLLAIDKKKKNPTKFHVLVFNISISVVKCCLQEQSDHIHPDLHFLADLGRGSRSHTGAGAK